MKSSRSLAVVLLAALFVVPSVSAQPLLKELERRLNEALAPRSPATATAEPGYLGLIADDAIGGERGVEVLSVNEGGPAEAAGLREADLIIAVNRKGVATVEDMASVMERLGPGDKVEFEFVRDGRRQVAIVQLGRKPADDARLADEPRRLEPLPRPDVAGDDFPARRGILGIQVSPITEEARRRYGFSVRRGALVAVVHRGTPAERAELPVGAVIVAVDGRRVDTSDFLIAYLRDARPGDEIDLTYYQGDDLFAKKIRLAAAGADELPRLPADADATPRPDRAPVVGEDRPILRRVEGILDRIVPPPDTPRTIESAEVVELKRTVQSLQDQVLLLEKRLAELEARLAAERAKKDGE